MFHVGGVGQPGQGTAPGATEANHRCDSVCSVVGAKWVDLLLRVPVLRLTGKAQGQPPFGSLKQETRTGIPLKSQLDPFVILVESILFQRTPGSFFEGTLKGLGLA